MDNNMYERSTAQVFGNKEDSRVTAIQPIGIDYGNEIIKVKTVEHELGMVNLIAPGRARRKLAADRAHPINLLDVEIESNGQDLGRWFVGGMAYKYSHSRLLNREEGGNKADYPYMVHSVLTALAYSVFDAAEPVKTVEIVLGTGLSAEEYWQYPDHRELVRSRLLGTHKVKFLNQVFNGAELTLIIKDVVVMPESSAAALAYVTGEDGSINSNSILQIEDSFNLIVDIGGFTTDVAVMYGGEFEDSFGFDSGIAEPLSLIAEALRRNYDIEVTRQQVGIALRRNKGILKTRQGDTVDINELKESFFRDFTVQIVNRLLRVLRDNDINRKQINKAYFVGGGALMLKDYLDEYVPDLEVDIISDPLMANVRGYFVSVRDSQGDEQEQSNSYDMDDIFMS